MEVGAEIDILPEPEAEAACADAGTKWNAARRKRCGTRGRVESIDGEKVKVQFEDQALDPETGEVVRVDKASLVFPAGATAVVDAAAEAAANSQEAVVARLEEARLEGAEKLKASELKSTQLAAEVASVTKKLDIQRLKVERLQKEIAATLKAAESSAAGAAEAEAGRLAAVARAEAAEASLEVVEQRLQMLMSAAQGGAEQVHNESTGEETVRAQNRFEIEVEVTDAHVYGSGGAKLCYEFELPGFDIFFGVWMRRTGLDVVQVGEQVVMMNEKYAAEDGVQRNDIPVNAAGTYILRWDNTHSRMRSKQLTYKAFVKCEAVRKGAHLNQMMSSMGDEMDLVMGSPSSIRRTSSGGAAALKAQLTAAEAEIAQLKAAPAPAPAAAAVAVAELAAAAAPAAGATEEKLASTEKELDMLKEVLAEVNARVASATQAQKLAEQGQAAAEARLEAEAEELCGLLEAGQAREQGLTTELARLSCLQQQQPPPTTTTTPPTTTQTPVARQVPATAATAVVGGLAAGSAGEGDTAATPLEMYDDDDIPDFDDIPDM